MYRKNANGWLKHIDFIILDMICLQIAFVVVSIPWWPILLRMEIYIYIIISFDGKRSSLIWDSLKL